MKKNTKSAKSKNKVSKVNKNKVAAAVETAPVTETAVDNTPVPVINIPAAVTKRSKGRPSGSCSASLVSLKSLVGALSESASIPVSNRLLKLLNQLGTKIESTPYKMDMGGIAAIAKKYQSANSTVAIVDLNNTEVTV